MKCYIGKFYPLCQQNDSRWWKRLFGQCLLCKERQISKLPANYWKSVLRTEEEMSWGGQQRSKQPEKPQTPGFNQPAHTRPTAQTFSSNGSNKNGKKK